MEELDDKIMELQGKLDELRRANDLIPKIEKDIAVLEQATAILGNRKKTEIGSSPDERGLKPLSVEIITTACRPMRVKELERKLHEIGREFKRASLLGELSRAVKDGTLVRTEPNTYDLTERNRGD